MCDAIADEAGIGAWDLMLELESTPVENGQRRHSSVPVGTAASQTELVSGVLMWGNISLKLV